MTPPTMKAATIATCYGADSSRIKTDHRLGSEWSKAEANTWQTFATALVNKDGSGYIRVKRGNKTINIGFGPETDELPTQSILGIAVDENRTKLRDSLLDLFIGDRDA